MCLLLADRGRRSGSPAPTGDGGWTIPNNTAPPPPATAFYAQAGTWMSLGHSETSQLGPSERLENPSGKGLTPLRAWGGHWEVIFLSLALSKATGTALQQPNI